MAWGITTIMTKRMVKHSDSQVQVKWIGRAEIMPINHIIPIGHSAMAA